MNVLSFTMGSATGGVPVHIAEAFRDEPGWNVRALVSMVNYIEYPQDLEWTRENIIRYWEAADVVHLHHGFLSADKLVNGRYAGKRLSHKPYVVEFHGTGFRESPEGFLNEVRDRGALPVVSTLDLYLLAPDEVEWLPQPMNVEALSSMRQPRNDGRVLIAHAPTNRQIKSTAQLLEAVERLQDEGYPIDLELIEHASWTDCLERKSRADIFFDQTLLGYGCNALEAWGMGIPVIAGAADETLDEMERRFGHLPFYHATEDTIYDALKELVDSPELRDQYGQIGFEYVKTWHSEEVVVEQLKETYLRAIEQQEKAA